jgi:hypothetical protein
VVLSTTGSLVAGIGVAVVVVGTFVLARSSGRPAADPPATLASEPETTHTLRNPILLESSSI